MHATTQDISTLLCLFCRYIYNLQQQQQDHRTQLTELRMNLDLSTTAGSTATQTTFIFLPSHSTSVFIHQGQVLVGGKRKEYKKTPKSFITMFTNTKLSKSQAGLWSQSPSLRLNSESVREVQGFVESVSDRCSGGEL